MTTHQIKSARELAQQLGQADIARQLKVGPTAVNNALARGAFPPSWYPVIRDMSLQKGIECPESAFNFKSPSSAPLSEAS
jgi:hypothetical protein